MVSRKANPQSFIGRIQKALDKRVHTVGMFIDLTKVYDILNHGKTILLQYKGHQ